MRDLKYAGLEICGTWNMRDLEYAGLEICGTWNMRDLKIHYSECGHFRFVINIFFNDLK